MRIERARKEDFKDLVELYLEGYRGLEEYAYTHRNDVRAYLEWLMRRDPEGLLTAKEGERIIGFIGADSNWFSKREQKKVGAVHELVVDQDFRKRGVGTALMASAVDLFRNKGLDTVELWVGDGNETAKKFYEKLGFREAGRYNYWIRMKTSLMELEESIRNKGRGSSL